MAIRRFTGRLAATGAASLRLFCFPHAGGGAAVFSQWPVSLPSNVELCVPCLPGRDARVDETPVAAISPLVDSLASELIPLLDQPCALFGHSTGAFIAFDLAHKLSGLGHPPIHLFVAAQRGPQLPYPAEPIYKLPDNEFLQVILSRYQSIPQQVLQQKDLMRIVLRTLRADFTLTEAYEYRATQKLVCRITAFGGVSDNQISLDQLQAWELETANQFRLHQLSGGHFFPQEQRDLLLKLIRESLT